MDILNNFNGLELLFIIVLILILFGPEKLPEIASRIGSYLRKLRSISSQIMDEWSREAGLDDLSAEGEKISSAVNQTLKDTRKDVSQIERKVSAEPGRSSSITTEKAPEAPSQATGDKRQQMYNRLEQLENELQKLRGEITRLDQQAEQTENHD